MLDRKSTKKIGKGQEGRQGKNKKRIIRVETDSSSCEESAIPFTQEFTTNQRAMARKALLSSSEDEVNSIHQSTDQIKTHLSERYVSEGNLPAVNTSDNNCLLPNSNCLSKKINMKESKILQYDQMSEECMLDELIEEFEPARTKSESSNLKNEMNSHVKSEVNNKHERKPLKSSDLSVSGLINGDASKSWGIFHNAKINEKQNVNSIQTCEKISSSVNKEFSPHPVKSYKNLIPNQTTTCDSSSSIDIYKNSNCVSVGKTSPEVSSIGSISSLLPPKDVTREERLRRQKEKQERYRKKLAQTQLASKSPLTMGETVNKNMSLNEASNVTSAPTTGSVCVKTSVSLSNMNTSTPTNQKLVTEFVNSKLSPEASSYISIPSKSKMMQDLENTKPSRVSISNVSTNVSYHCFLYLYNCLKARKIKWKKDTKKKEYINRKKIFKQPNNCN